MVEFYVEEEEKDLLVCAKSGNEEERRRGVVDVMINNFREYVRKREIFLLNSRDKMPPESLRYTQLTSRLAELEELRNNIGKLIPPIKNKKDEMKMVKLRIKSTYIIELEEEEYTKLITCLQAWVSLKLQNRVITPEELESLSEKAKFLLKYIKDE